MEGLPKCMCGGKLCVQDKPTNICNMRTRKSFGFTQPCVVLQCDSCKQLYTRKEQQHAHARRQSRR